MPIVSLVHKQIDARSDQRAASRILQRVRELLDAAPLAEVIAGEDFPTDAVASDPASALAYARHHGATVYQGVGSCAMGPTSDDIPDAPVMALAWLAADLLD